MVWLLWQWEEVAAALEGESLRGQAAKAGGRGGLRFGLAGIDTDSEPGWRRVCLDYASLHKTASPLCTSLCQGRGPLQRALR